MVFKEDELRKSQLFSWYNLLNDIIKIHGALEQYIIWISYQILKMQEIISGDDEPIDLIQNINLQNVFESYAWPIIDYEHDLIEMEK